MSMSRTILVTGSASGIGKATAALLRARGCNVIGLDIQDTGRSDTDIIADLSTVQGRRHGISKTLQMSGGTLDGVVACAGLAGADAKAMVAVNYFGTVSIVEGLHNALMSSSAPRVAIISSSAIILPSHHPLVDACLSGNEAAALDEAAGNDVLTYASTKLSLSRWIRRTAILPEWAGNGILINGIAPGPVRTPMTAPILATAEGRAMLAEVTPIALNDYAEPEHIARLLAFLASPDCCYMVGQNIFIDGGTDIISRGEQQI
jgi:NAD(P)-dependent dehydrogenase (short-subunit alcohol dehydrogenase family)